MNNNGMSPVGTSSFSSSPSPPIPAFVSSSFSSSSYSAPSSTPVVSGGGGGGDGILSSSVLTAAPIDRTTSRDASVPIDVGDGGDDAGYDDFDSSDDEAIIHSSYAIERGCEEEGNDKDSPFVRRYYL